MRLIRSKLSVLIALSAVVLSPAIAHQTQATADTLTEPQVRAILAENGFTRIDDLDFEDGMWETDATSANGERVDVRVNPTTGDILVEKLVSTLSEADVKAKLAAAGYSKIHDVDFDDGMWKAEAEESDGNDVEIHLDANSGQIVHIEND